MTTREFKLLVNGRAQTVTTSPDRPLVEVLREELNLTGTKVGCMEGQCGACTILLDNEPVLSCLMTVSDVGNRSIRTIEGLADGEHLHPVQEAFLKEQAFQCGQCTPGMILETVALLRKKPRPSDQEIAASLDGHLCRCCGYPRIISAVHRAAQRLESGGVS
ncbi:MAG TPA: (2Fe-2S)-binding protein [Candidatus Paceibacterota bacterium]|nr:(2Fe-2S)-binding protein [Verrucomicrobiota bacterium]HRY48902.1 (2Fe-2S)-binding protein [Candidatus Paceibacterota bacterium]HRZ99957.1 (2Fe-2S)-binding protein [Candidatus Paceibacterota bacterium]